MKVLVMEEEAMVRAMLLMLLLAQLFLQPKLYEMEKWTFTGAKRKGTNLVNQDTWTRALVTVGEQLLLLKRRDMEGECHKSIARWGRIERCISLYTLSAAAAGQQRRMCGENLLDSVCICSQLANGALFSAYRLHASSSKGRHIKGEAVPWRMLVEDEHHFGRQWVLSANTKKTVYS